MNNKLLINKEVFEEYKAKDYLKNIYLYKFFIIVLIIVDIIIVSFIFLLSHEKSIINLTNISVSNQIASKEIVNENKLRIISNNLVTLYSDISIFKKEFTNIIKTEEEMKSLLNWVNKDEDEYNLYVCYMYHPDSYEPLDICQAEKNQFFLIQTTSNNRFGAILQNYNYNEDELYDKGAFLFNLDTKTIFPIKESRIAYNRSNKSKIISFGDDLIIDKNYLNQGSYSNFPSSYGNDETDTLKALTGGEQHFLVKYLEIFSLKRKREKKN